MASRDGRDGSLKIHQDVRILAGRLEPGAKVTATLDAARLAWLQVARGEMNAGSQLLREGDGVAISGESSLELRASESAEVLLFDLPPLR